MVPERKVLADGAEARKETLRAGRIAESTHAPLALPCGLMTVLGPIVHAGSRFDEDMLDASQGGDPGLGDRVTEELVGDDLAWHGVSGQQAFEEALCRSDVASLL